MGRNKLSNQTTDFKSINKFQALSKEIKLFL